MSDIMVFISLIQEELIAKGIQPPVS